MSKKTQAGLTPEEWALWTELTNRIKVGEYMPEQAYFARNRLGYTAIDLAITRAQPEYHELLLERRGSKDPFWPGAWHLNGGEVRATKNNEETLARLSQEELHGLNLRDARFMHSFNFPKELRGPYHSLFYLLQVQELPFRQSRTHKFFPIDALPTPMIQSHVTIVHWLRRYLAR